MDTLLVSPEGLFYIYLKYKYIENRISCATFQGQQNSVRIFWL